MGQRVILVGHCGVDAPRLRARALADANDLHAARLSIQLVPVLEQLLIIRQEIILPDLVSEFFLRAGNA